tara:strand:- start:5 stop:676 length:672 start_codon:yes stop_codon:yes gene_type:complete
MKSSLSKIQLFDYIKSLIDYNLPDNKKFSTRNLKTMIFDGLDRLEYSFSNVKDKYFNDNNQACFNHLNSDHMVVLLYYISNTGYQMKFDSHLLEKIYYLNKIMHSVDIFYSVMLPKIFCVAHPLGTILGHAKYSDYLYVYQNVTVGSTNDGIYPEFGKFIALSSNTSIIGDCKVGNNVLFGGNSFIINKHIPDNSLVLGHYPNNRVVENKTPVFERLFERKDL